MNRKQAKEFYPVLQAFAEGKIIETRRKPTADNNGVTKDGWFEFNDWTEMKELEYWVNVDYRIKPEPKYRPFKNAEECWHEMERHQPFGWIYDGGYRSSIVSICDTTVDIVNISTNDIMECLFSEMIEEGYTFSDGTPFGIKEK